MRRELLSRRTRPVRAGVWARLGLYGAVAAVAVATATPAGAGSGATFTLGLAAEYLADSQEYRGVTAERSNLRTMIWLAASGHLVDPRFLLFDASVAQAFNDQTISDQPDSDVDDTYYDGSLRFFSNRAVSFEVGAGRQSTDISGLPQGAIVDGVRDYQRYALRALGGQWFRLQLRHWEQRFTADQPDTLRDEDTSWSELNSQAAVGKVDAMLQLLWKEADLFGGGLQQEIGTGRVDLDVNRDGRLYWHTDLIGNLYRSAQDHGVFAPWTENYLFRNRLRHRYSQLGFWDLNADLRMIRVDTDPEQRVVTGNASARVIAPLNRSTFLEGEVGYLTNEYADGLRLNQPRVGVGVRWGQQFGRWWLSLYPRVVYIRANPEELESESSLGSLFFGSIRYQLARSSVTFEAEYYDNQLSIPEDTAGLYPFGAAFLAGLDQRRYRGRVILQFHPGPRTGFSIEGDHRNRVRLDRNREIEETVSRVQLNVILGRVTIGASGDRYELDGGEVPTLTDVWQADISWAPTYWLIVDGFVRSEERTVFDRVGRYDYAEAGVRFNYAKLSFYARYREQRTDEGGLEERRFSRVWAGVRRTFEFLAGERLR